MSRPSQIRPAEGDPITVLFEINGMPVTYVSRAGRVSPTTLFVPRSVAEPRSPVDPQGQAVVLFTSDGRLFGWPMRVEEVLPSSYYLVSVQDPGEGDRREFVRARLAVWLALALPGEPLAPIRRVEADVSASGLRAPWERELPEGAVIDVLVRGEGESHEVRARARVVRTVAHDGQREIACEFVDLDSQSEERLLQVVFRAREAALHERIGRRDFI